MTSSKGSFAMTMLLTDRVEHAERPSAGWAPLIVVLAGTFVTFLDFFIVNVALADIGRDLHADGATLSLVVAGYGLTFAAGMITGGRLGDLYGRRRMFCLGLALFTVMSAACGVAPSAGMLVAARLLQGAAGALLTPQVLAILGTTYTDSRRNRAFAAYGFAMGIAGVAGQLLGGALIAADVAGLGWRSIFLLNIPFGVITLVFGRRVLPESRSGEHDGARLDITGMLLGTAAVGALVLPLAEGRDRGWPLWTWLSLAGAPLLGAAFIAHQRRRHTAERAPLVELRLFRIRSFAVGSLAGFTFGLVPAAFFFVLALYLQVGRGFTALFSGEVFGVVGFGYLIAMITATAAHARLGRQVLALGACLVAAGCAALGLAAFGASAMELAPGLGLIGLGIGYVLVPLSATVLADVEPGHAGGAAGVLATAQQVGGAVGVAAMSSVFFGVGGGVAHAFVVGLGVLAALTAITAVLAQFLRAS
jgi:EmrB/QacA subfamily drug resistance transporter